MITFHPQVQGADFAANFRQFDDERPLYLRVWHIVEACFQMIAHLFKMLYRAITFSADASVCPTPILGADGKHQFDLSQLPWKDDASSEGLYLFIHGLGGRPHDWVNYLETLDDKFHRLAPRIPSSGRCSLEDAARPLLPIIEDYLKKFPGAPVYLIGTSNGGRIASYLETELSPDLMENHELSVISIAGVHGGTVMMDFLKQIGLGCIFGPVVADNFSYDSQFSRDLLARWQAKQNEWETHNIQVSHRFYATTEEEQVRPVSSAFPFLPNTQDDDYRIIHGHAHMTVVDGVREEILA